MSRGVLPFRPVVEGLEDRVVPYVLQGSSWASTTVTASFMPDGVTTQNGYASDLFATLNARFPTATWQREFARALQTWANASRLNFYFVADSGQPSGTAGATGDIRLAMSHRDDSAAGRAYYPTGSSLGGDVFMSSNYTWQIGSYLDLYSCVLHELGHSLGLMHSDVPGAIMAPTIGTVYTGLGADDIAGIQAIYGARQNDSYDSGSGNNAFGTASAIGLNASGAAAFNADLTSMGDLDYYRFTAPANASGNLTVSASAAGRSLLNPKVQVYDAAFNLVGSASATTYGGTATLNLGGLVAGATYYVVADGATSDEFGMGAYGLSAQFGLGAAQPSVSVGNVSLTEGNSGTKQFNFTVSLSAASSGTVTVQYATANGSAASGTDYTAASGTLTFAPGETSKTVTVLVNGDAAVESDETFVVNLSSPTNATLGTSQGTGTIQNDDVPAVSIGNVSVNEGNSGTTQFNFTVSLSAASGNTVTVQYATANGTAASGSDYASTSSTLTFAPGETQKTVTVNVNGDTTVEANETFLVNLTSPTNATIGTSQGTGTIQNDDSPTLAIGNVSVAEGNSGTTSFTFTVSLSVASSNTVTVNYATANGSASSGSDYTSTSGTVTFAPGETSKTVTVLVNGDTAVESDETFLVNLTSPTNATIGTSQGTGTIQNDDLPAVSIGNASLTEGNSGAKLFTFTVSLSAASSNTVTVQYATANGTAASGSDYASTSSTLTFAPGETSKTVTVLVTGDAAVESDETFVVNLSSPTNATLGTSQGTGTIQNDDSTSISIGNVSIAEGSGGTAQLTFTVSLSAANPNTVTVQYATADVTAVAGSDYAATGGTLTFAPGETQKTVTVTVTGDAAGESNETFRLVLSSPTNGTLANSQGTGTILNDDAVRDRFEPSNRPKNARYFGSLMTLTRGNLSLHVAGDQDFYSFVPTRSRTFDVTVTPTQGSGRVDVAILNAARAQIASGSSESGPVTVTAALQGGQKYYVVVKSETGGVFTYSLGVAKTTSAPLLLAPDGMPQAPADTPVAFDDSVLPERVRPAREFGAGKPPKAQKVDGAADNLVFLPAGDAATTGTPDDLPLDIPCGCAMCSGAVLIPGA